MNAPKQLADAVIKFYTPQLEEMRELLGKRPDPQLVEGYNHLSKPNQRKRLAFFETLVSDAEKFTFAKKTTRKPRAKKVKSAVDLTKNMKYLPESNEYKLVSSSPEDIIGAREVYLFNPKYKSVTHLVSADEHGLSVKGSTIIGFDPDKGGKRSLRKPNEYLAETLGSTMAKSRKAFNALKTKHYEPNGRVNANTIIMRVFK